MKKNFVILINCFLFILFCVTLVYADSGVLVLLNNGDKYFIPSDEIDHIEFIYERNENDDQVNSPSHHVNTKVNFNYTYHMQNKASVSEDWFNTHIGTVCLYVFNDKDEFLFQREIINSGEENQYNNSTIFTEDELKPGETYKLGAFAFGNKKGYKSSLLSPGFKLINSIEPLSSKIEDLILKIDSEKDENDNSIVDYKEYFSGNELKLDTLWTTQSDNIISFTIPISNTSSDLNEDLVLDIDIPLMRITNSLKINLLSDYFNKETNIEDYEFVIDFPQGNDLIDLYGNITPNGSLLYYPLRKAIKPYTSKSTNAIYNSEEENGGFLGEGENIDIDDLRYSLSADFGIGRLMTKDKSVLKIINKSSRQVILMLEDLSDWLVDYFNSSYNGQDFLDREYDFSIDLQIDNQEKLVMIQAGCAGFGWGKRIYYYDLN